MYLFVRRGRILTGGTRETMAWATTVTEKVNQITSLDVGLWGTVFSPAVGTIAWASFVPDLATLEAADAKLMADDLFVAEVDRGRMVMGGLDDTITNVIHPQELGPNRTLEYVSVIEAQLVAGGLTAGMELCIELAKRAEEVTGLPVVFGADGTGDYGKVRWLTGYANVQELERASTAMGMDPVIATRLDQDGKDCFLEAPGGATQTIYRRLA